MATTHRRVTDPPTTERRPLDTTPFSRLELRGHWVYFVSDATSGALLYIGCTNNPTRRVAEHHATKRYRRTEVTYEVEGPFSSVEAHGLERRRIVEMSPRDNDRLRKGA